MQLKLGRSIFFVLGIALGWISTGPSAAAADAADSVSATDSYVRAIPPGQTVSAAFMRLQNDSPNDHAIVSAESPVARVVELHTHIMEGGMMKMRQVEKIDLPAQSETRLQPGGLHVMLMGLTGELKIGEKITITLVFDDGSSKEIQAPVRKMKMKMNMHKHMH